ncbi:heavy metal response regulator transcription factor [Alteromonas confluentis]|uniref:DNA-binding response regulator n=1 Tax=Alteromonas confluentis TaxID=1656094 RepID=A0A1E7ZFB2_9ALTE|nr:heavy metal response regulator transcription factor [Alteromonas confluentis]OFC72218.1 DNA-binding response regulator [Alteromonas confluentis]
MKILIVEDEQKTLRYLTKALEENGFVIDGVDDGIDGLHMALEQDYEAIILDVMLPGIDGYQVLERLRKRKQTPVLMLSARGNVEERVKGLQKGADDYLPKPFSLVELIARIQALVRRRHNDTRDISELNIADLNINLLSRKVFRSHHRIELTAKEYSLLSLLARHEGEILSKLMIAEQVWDMNFDSDANVVEVAVKRLRAKIDTPFATKLLHTVRGMGYVLEERGNQDV